MRPMSPDLHNAIAASCQAGRAWRQIPFLPRSKVGWVLAVPAALAFAVGAITHLGLAWSLLSTGQANGPEWMVAFLLGVPGWLVCLVLSGWSTILPAWRSRLMFWCLGLSLTAIMCWGFGMGLPWGLTLLI